VSLPVADRFRSKVAVQADGCWLWTGRLNSNGYGAFYPGGKPRHWYAHRWSYVNSVGPVPKDLELDHLCRRPACVNPAHLEAVTRRENIVRASRVSGNGPHQVAKAHCPSGHPYSAANTKTRRVVGVSGRKYLKRSCRICVNEQARKYYRQRERDAHKRHAERNGGAR
jgi:hypothetical protein